MNYIKQEDLKDFNFLQVPRTVWNMYLNNEIVEIGFKIYVEFFDRLKLSAYNNWIDKEGNVYIKYSYEELMDIFNLKSKGTISKGIKCLKDLGLIMQEKGFNTSSKFYLSNVLKSTVVHEREHSSTQMETQKYTNVDANNNNYNHNNSINNKKTYIKGRHSLLDCRYKNISEFKEDIAKHTNSEVIREILEKTYHKFLEYGINHYKLNKEQFDNIIEQINDTVCEVCENWEQIFDMLDFYFMLDRKYYSMQDLYSYKTLGYVMSKLGIVELQRFDIDGYNPDC